MIRKRKAKVRVPKNAKERLEKKAYDKLCYTDLTTHFQIAAAQRWAKKTGIPIKPRKKTSKRK